MSIIGNEFPQLSIIYGYYWKRIPVIDHNLLLKNIMAIMGYYGNSFLNITITS